MRTNNIRRAPIAIAGVLAAVLSLTACGTSSAGSSTNDLALPKTMSDLIAQSKQESDLIIYGNPAADYAKPLFKAFEKKYPWIRVQYSDLNDTQIFSKYQSERAQDARTADVIINSSSKLFLNAVSNGLIATGDEPAGLSDFPANTTLAPGVYAMSQDPGLLMYNEKLLAGKTIPHSWAQLAQLAKSDPSTYKLVAVNMTNGEAYTETYGLQHILGDKIWSYFQDLAPETTTYGNGGQAILQVQQGGAALYFSASGFLQGPLRQYAGQFGYTFMSDGTPVVPRGIAITSNAKSPASAQLLLDYLFSTEGQTEMSKVGFEATMNGFTSPDGYTNTLADLEKKVDPANLYTAPFNDEIASEQQGITDRWNHTFGS